MANKKLIATYGTLRQGQSNHYIMGDAKLLGVTNTTAKYTMYGKTKFFPIVRREGNTSIQIEVYEVTNENTIQNIYSLEGYKGVQGSSRNWYDVDIVDTEFGKAEMFVMDNNNSNSDIIENGNWLNR